MIDYLSQATLLRLLAVLGLVLAPHFPRLPLWEGAAIIAVAIWRALASMRQWRMPGKLIRATLTIIAFAAVYASYGGVSGQNPGVALLVIMLALKLTEMRARRDVMVVVLLMYFILITHFFYSQEIWTIAYLLFSALAITAVLIEANHPAQALAPRISLRLATTMLLQALPLMALIFLLFPRIPGPLWGLPVDAGASRSGLSDSMEPGDISRLIPSGAIAFRVTFDTPPPAMRERYWRGPVFDFFDGRAWRESFRGADLAPASESLGPALSYEVTLEPNRTPWLFTLDLPSPYALPPESRLNSVYQLVADKPVIDRIRYRAVSRTRYRLQPQLEAQERYAVLPAKSNPRSRELAQRWRAQGLSDAALVQTALTMFREEKFFYTLEPPPLGRNSVDDFLFGSRRGFCEHYASSFTFLMRAAGVPARVVTGYQGGEQNPIGGYYVVRQSDAHAWSEVWLQDQGWVRIDPTAAVAPERIENGYRRAEAAEAFGDGLLGDRLDWTGLRFQLEARWDFVNARWNEWVLAYGPQQQQDFLSRFGVNNIRDMILTLTFGITAILLLVGFWLLRRAAKPPLREPALILWQRAQRQLRRFDVQQRADEGPRDFAERVTRAHPLLAATMQQLLDAYLALRYLGNDAAAEKKLVAAIARLRRINRRRP